MTEITVGDITAYYYGNIDHVCSCVLSANYHLVCYEDAADGEKVKARIAQISGNEVIMHTAVEIDASASAGVSCCTKDTDEAFIFWTDDTPGTNMEGVWIERDGTSITVKTPTAINDPAAETKKFTKCCQLTTDKALLIYGNEEGGGDEEVFAICVTPNGDAIQVGTAIQMDADTGANAYLYSSMDVVQMDTDVAIAVVHNLDATQWTAYHITAAVAVLTEESTVSSAVGAQNYSVGLAKLSTTKAACLYAATTEEGYGLILDISAAITKSTPVVVGSEEWPHGISGLRIDDTHAMFIYLDNDSAATVVVATESGGEVTFSLKTQVDSVVGHLRNLSLSLISTTSKVWKFLALFRYSVYPQNAIIQYSSPGTATGYMGQGSDITTDNPRLVATGDADVSIFRIYEGAAVRSLDAVAKNDTFNPFPLRMYKGAVYPIRDEAV